MLKKGRLTKCVIPAAGLGTRLLPLTKTCPKEMIEVGGRPMIDWVIEEALESGLNEICLISRPGKVVMESHVIELLNRKYRPGISFCCLEQEKPLGLGRAIALARDFVEDQPFALMLPDNLVGAAEPVIRQMEPAFRKYGLGINALMKIHSPQQAKRFGNSGKAELEYLAPAVSRVKKIYPKRKDNFPWKPGGGNFRLYPRIILSAEFYTYLSELSPPPPAQFDDVPIFQKMAEEGRLLGYDCRAEVHDVGNPEGLGYARLHFTA